jgi:hypothetical protein
MTLSFLVWLTHSLTRSQEVQQEKKKQQQFLAHRAQVFEIQKEQPANKKKRTTKKALLFTVAHYCHAASFLLVAVGPLSFFVVAFCFFCVTMSQLNKA